MNIFFKARKKARHKPSCRAVTCLIVLRLLTRMLLILPFAWGGNSPAKNRISYRCAGIPGSRK